MSKLVLTGDNEIRQFTVEVDGLYAWRSTKHNADQKDTGWNFGPLKRGERIDGQYEGCGPLHWNSV